MGKIDQELHSIISILLLFQILLALHAFRITVHAEQLMNSLGKVRAMSFSIPH